MTTPAIVQSAFGRGNTSPITAALAAAPTVGNTLYILVCGFGGNTLTLPAGFTTVEADAGHSAADEGTWIYSKAVAAGDPAAWSLTGATDWHNVAVFEVSGSITTTIPANGGCGGQYSNTLTFNLTAAPDPTTSLRLTMITYDNTRSVTTPTGWTMLSPAGWNDGVDGGNHCGAIFTLDPATSGAQGVNLSSYVLEPVFADLILSATTPVISGRVSRANLDVLSFDPSPPAAISSVFAEVIVSTVVVQISGQAMTTSLEIVASDPSPGAAISSVFAEVIASIPVGQGMLTSLEVIASDPSPPAVTGPTLIEVLAMTGNVAPRPPVNAMTISALRTVVVGVPVNIYGIRQIQPMLRWPMAEPDEVLDYALDVSALLSDVGDSIASATLAVSPSGTGELVASALTVLGGVIMPWLSGGVSGRNYRIRIDVTTNAARTFSWVVGLLIDPWQAAFPLRAAPSADFGTPVTWNPGAIVVGPPLGFVDVGLVATGANQATALSLTALTNVFTGGAAGAGGILPDTVLSGTIIVVNADVLDKLIYPPEGASIGSGPANIPVIVSPNQRVEFVTRSAATKWYAA